MTGLDRDSRHVGGKTSYTKYSRERVSEIGGTSDTAQTDSYRMCVHPTKALFGLVEYSILKFFTNQV